MDSGRRFEGGETHRELSAEEREKARKEALDALVSSAREASAGTFSEEDLGELRKQFAVILDIYTPEAK